MQPSALITHDETQAAEAQAETNFAAPTELPPSALLASAPAPEKVSRTEESILDDRDEQHEARVTARIAQLRNLSTKTDRASLDTLLSEVKNPELEIRQAALDAISQPGHRAAIPALREVAAQTEDSRDKQAIVDVIEFISLPTLTELLRGGATNNRGAAQVRP